MVELLEDLEKKHKNFKEKYNAYADERDKYNNEVKKLAEKRDEYNSKTREMIKQAKESKSLRDEYNIKVKELKNLRNEWNGKLQEISVKLREVKSKHGSKRIEMDVDQLKRKVKNLDFKQQTTVLTSEKERELIEVIEKIYKEINAYEKKLEEELKNDSEVSKYKNEFIEIKKNAENHHQMLEEYVNKAQDMHNNMIEFFEKAEESRKKADDIHNELVKIKSVADEVHMKCMDVKKELRDFEKIIIGLKKKHKLEKKKEKDDTLQKRAEVIYDKFKKGEQVTTEDLMILQKSGFI